MTAEAVPDPLVRAQQCKAKAKQSGKRCRNPAIPGGVVCRVHGGSAPAVRRKAGLRLAELVNPALAQLARELINTTTGTPMSRLRAIENILDRAGYPRRAEVSGDPDAAREMLKARLWELVQQHQQAAPGVHEIIEGNPVDPEG